jgi:hypothetical protein
MLDGKCGRAAEEFNLPERAISPPSNLIGATRGAPSRCTALERHALEPEFGEGLAAEIRRVWAQGSANTLELAKVVSAARKRLKRTWAEFWRSANIGFSKRKADMLVGIARLDGLNEQTFAHLPRTWTILHYLARLEHEVLEKLVRNGVVHQELTLPEAKALVRRRGTPRPAGAKRPKVRAIVNQFDKFVGGTLPEWSASQVQFAGTRLRELLQRIEMMHCSLSNNGTDKES